MVNLKFMGAEIVLNSNTQYNMSKIEEDIHSYIPQNNLGGPIPYIGYREVEEVVHKINVLEELNLKIADIQNLSVLNCLAGYHYIRRDFDKAIEIYTLALNLVIANSSDKAFLKSNLGWCYYRKKDARRSYNYFSEAIEIDPNTSWALLGIGAVKKNFGKAKDEYSNYVTDLDNAKDLFNKQLLKIKFDYLSHIGLANVYREYGNHNEAINQLTKAININQNIAIGYYNRAGYFLSLNTENEGTENEKLNLNESVKRLVVEDLVQAFILNPLFKSFAREDEMFKLFRSHSCFVCLVGPQS